MHTLSRYQPVGLLCLVSKLVANRTRLQALSARLLVPMLLMLGTLSFAVHASGLVSHPRAAWGAPRVVGHVVPRCGAASLGLQDRPEAAVAADQRLGTDDQRLGAAFLAAGGATSVAWTACAVASLATYKPHRIVHNSIGVAGALSALPLVWAVCGALAAAARRGGRAALRQVEYRRLSLGLAAASVWSIVAVACSPILTAATVRTSDPARPRA